MSGARQCGRAAAGAATNSADWGCTCCSHSRGTMREARQWGDTMLGCDGATTDNGWCVLRWREEAILLCSGSRGGQEGGRAGSTPGMRHGWAMAGTWQSFCGCFNRVSKAGPVLQTNLLTLACDTGHGWHLAEFCGCFNRVSKAGPALQMHSTRAMAGAWQLARRGQLCFDWRAG